MLHRQLLFRGQTRKKGQKVKLDGSPVDGNWVYGGIFPGTGDYSVIYGAAKENFTGLDLEKHVVYSDTVGQYTGLQEKNGTRIFEGDICRNTKTGEIVSVKWHGTMAGYVWSKPKEDNKYLYDFGELFRVYDKYEVIGNIYDNPELLKKDGAIHE